MGWLIKQFTGALGPYLIVGLGVMLLLSIGSTALLYRSNGKLHEKIATLSASNNSLVSANQNNQQTINELTSANEHWKALLDGQDQRDADAKAKQLALEASLRSANATLAASLSKERQEPSCEAVLQMDIQRLCPIRAQRMRNDAGR